MEILLFRHGLTAGNLKKRYVGRTDEPLCEQGIAEISDVTVPQCDVLIVSPMLRCKQTASILFPKQKQNVCSEFRECDFGKFEGRNYMELSNDPEYQRWVDSHAKLPFPGGESRKEFRTSVNAAFEMMISRNCNADSIAFVVHGGTIMSIMGKFGVLEDEYYLWRIPNGHGILTQLKNGRLVVREYI